MVKEMYPLHCCIPREVLDMIQGFHGGELGVIFWVVASCNLVVGMFQRLCCLHLHIKNLSG
jgi:hypothetical protein